MVPEANLLPGSTVGLKAPLSCLTQARYGITWGVIGAAQACFAQALDYARTRELFGRPLAANQAVQVRLAEMARRITTSQLLYAFTMRSSRPLRAGGLRPNPQLNRAVGFTLAAQAGVLLLPGARRLLRVAPVSPLDLVVVGATAMLPLLVREGLKERAWRQPAAGSPAAGPTASTSASGPARRDAGRDE